MLLIRKIVLLGSLLSLISCNPCNPPKVCLPCCYDGRRPQVMHYESTWVEDYEDVMPEECCDPCHTCCEENIQPLTPDMFIPDPILDKSRLGVGDVVKVKVMDEEELSLEETVVAPDGCLYCSLLPPVPAANHTLQEVRADLISETEKLVQDPVLSLIPQKMVDQKFYILGRVNLPGEYPILAPMTLREAIGVAGGPVSVYNSGDDVSLQRADLIDYSRSFIVRGEKKLAVNFQELLESEGRSQNIYIKPGDYIYIAPALHEEIFVLGAVLAPQRISYHRGMTLLGALASSGGWMTPGPYSPDLGRILVIRGSLQCPRVVCIDLLDILHGCSRDFYLMPGDIVYASNKNFRFGRELVRLAINAFVISFSAEAGNYYADQLIFGRSSPRDE